MDDQAMFRRIADDVIAATEGFEVVGAADSGEEALKAVQPLGPDLVLLDVRMPGLHGIEVARRPRVRDHLAREVDFLIRHGTPDLPSCAVVIDISRVDEVSGALIGALLRASRRLAWRNRRLTIVCSQVELRRRLEIAGLDELADVTAALDPR